MPENWYALFLAIVYPKQIGSEEALLILRSPSRKKPRRNDIDETQMRDMMRLKESGKTYDEIGKIYGLNRNTVGSRVRRYQGVS